MREVKIVNKNLQFGDLSNRQKTDLIVLHHTGNPTDDDCSAEEIHASHLAKGWSGIGYHYVIRENGTIEEGRPHWVIGAHAYGENSHSIGIHLCGNFQICKPTKEQIEAVSMLVGKLCLDYGLPVTAQYIKGHRDVGRTVCPGNNLYKLLQTIRGKAIWYQQN